MASIRRVCGCFVSTKKESFYMRYVNCLLAFLFIVLAGFYMNPGAQADNTKAPTQTECKTECDSCATMCAKTLTYCQKKGGKHMQGEHTKTMKDCISTCKMSGEMIGRGSTLSSKSCSLCKDACNKCAETCESFKGDKKMKDCAEACRKCATSCEKMAS